MANTYENYVKFVRGTPAAYKKTSKTDDTLYFIYDNDASTGSLYLGEKLIAGTGANALNELSDVKIEGDLQLNDLLVYDGEGSWVVTNLAALIESVPALKETSVYEVSCDAGEDHIAAIELALAGATPVKGSVAIVSEKLTEKVDLTTAYIYNGTAWAALNGNYNAENVYFDEDFTFTTNVGTVTLAASDNGSKTVDAAGKNVREFFASLFAKEQNPATTQPSVSVSTLATRTYEAGTSVSPTWSATLSAGSYTYGPATGVVAKSWSITDTEGNTADTASGTMPPMTITDSTRYKITATATYDAGATPVTNLGNDYAAGQIQAGSKSNSCGEYTGYRCSFYGSKTAAVELNSANIRALTKSNSSTKTLKVTVVEGAKQVVIAVPSGLSVTKVADEGAFGTDIFSEFTKSTVSVGGADATSESIGSYAKDYNVYVYAPATALGANTYTVTVA